MWILYLHNGLLGQHFIDNVIWTVEKWCELSVDCIKVKWAATCDFQQCCILTSVDSYETVQPPYKPRNSKWCSVSSLTLIEYLATSKCSDQIARMRRLIWDFAGRTYHIVGNLMSRLKLISRWGSWHENFWDNHQQRKLISLMKEVPQNFTFEFLCWLSMQNYIHYFKLLIFSNHLSYWEENIIQ